jgi:purine-binding chemotaxis protein CheW
MTELHVLFKVAGVEYSLPAREIVFMDAYAGATRVPGTPRWIVGLVQVRGRVVTAIDLGLRFGAEAITPGLGTRVIVIEREQRLLGLVVESARDVVRIESTEVHSPPSMIGDAEHRFVRGVVKVADRLVMQLDLDRVIGAEAEGQQHGEERL